MTNECSIQGTLELDHYSLNVFKSVRPSVIELIGIPFLISALQCYIYFVYGQF